VDRPLGPRQRRAVKAWWGLVALQGLAAGASLLWMPAEPRSLLLLLDFFLILSLLPFAQRGSRLAQWVLGVFGIYVAGKTVIALLMLGFLLVVDPAGSEPAGTAFVALHLAGVLALAWPAMYIWPYAKEEQDAATRWVRGRRERAYAERGGRSVTPGGLRRRQT